MHNLLHELLVISTDERDQITKYEEQLEQLIRLRYTQKSMGNADVVEEYDFASTTLVRELISLAETTPEYPKNSTLQKLVDDIRLADERVINYREDYDLIVIDYNEFLDENKSLFRGSQPERHTGEEIPFSDGLCRIDDRFPILSERIILITPINNCARLS